MKKIPILTFKALNLNNPIISRLVESITEKREKDPDQVTDEEVVLFTFTFLRSDRLGGMDPVLFYRLAKICAYLSEKCLCEYGMLKESVVDKEMTDADFEILELTRKFIKKERDRAELGIMVEMPDMDDLKKIFSDN